MKQRGRRIFRKSWMLLALLAFACDAEVPRVVAQSQATRVPLQRDPRVILFIIDGPRYSEAFGDSLHEHVPHLWDELRPLGTLCTNFRNAGLTLTNPGHATILTGVWQAISNDGSERTAQPTLFEYYRKQTGAPPQDAVLITGKPKLAVCAYSDDPEHGPAYAAQAEVDLVSDYGVFDRLIQRLEVDAPHLVMASFSEVDLKGHSGVWSDYLRQIEIVDSLAALTWNYLQSDPDYADRTYLFVTADHGRHDDAHGGFQHHGDTCEGCRHLVFLALGPGIRAGYETASLYTQRDVCATVGSVLGIDTPRSDGARMDEIFAPISTGIVH
jgi:hypothetical protein